MESIEKRIISAHDWVRTDGRDFTPRGHKPVGESSTSVDKIYVPFLNTTYVLVFESSWATIGGTRQDAVLYAYDHRSGNRRKVDSHTILNGRDPLSSFYPTKIRAVISFVTKDVPAFDHPCPTGEGEIFRGCSFERKSNVRVRISMCREQEASCEIRGTYAIAHFKSVRRGYYAPGWEEESVASQQWETGKVESSVLTKRNICRFYKKYHAELPAIAGEIGAG